MSQLQKLQVIADDKHLRTVLIEQIRDPEGIGFVEITLKELP